jgi:hypothetical protein
VPDDAVVVLALSLLAHLEHGELSVKEAMDRIELVTTVPDKQRAILDLAVERGIVEREGGTIVPVATGTYVSFQRDVVVKEGDFACRRCGTALSSGHFVRLEDGELGPFGSTCIRTVLGRE